MPISDSAATELAQLLGIGTAGELIPELVRQGLQALISRRKQLLPLVPFDTSAPLSGAATATAALKACWPHQRATCSCASAVRDDVLARLLALNAERYAEEVALGLHSKGAKQAAKAGGKRRERPAKTIQGVETEGQQVEQIGLGL